MKLNTQAAGPASVIMTSHPVPVLTDRGRASLVGVPTPVVVVPQVTLSETLVVIALTVAAVSLVVPHWTTVEVGYANNFKRDSTNTIGLWGNCHCYWFTRYEPPGLEGQQGKRLCTPNQVSGRFLEWEYM